MKKTTRRQTRNSDLAQKRRLELARQTVRTLDADDLVQAAGGSGCDTNTTPISLTSKH